MIDPVSNAVELTSLGPPGAIIAMLSGFIYFLIREHRAERAEWIQAYKESTAMWANQQKERTRVWEKSQNELYSLLTRIFIDHENIMKSIRRGDD